MASGDGDGDAWAPSSMRHFRFAAVLMALVSLAAPVYLSLLVWRFGVDVPFYDEWDMVDTLRRVHEGKFLFSDFFAQHNDHRVLFPRLILISTAQATGWNIRYELAINVFFAWILMGILAVQIVATARKVRSIGLLALLPVASLVVFSLAQYENWLWGWQNQIFLAALGVCGALFLLSSAHLSAWRFVAAATLGFVATFSFANGLLVWPLGLVPLAALGKLSTTRTRVVLALWMAVSGVMVFAYFYGFRFPSHGGSGQEKGWSSPESLIKYYVTYIGTASFPMSVDRAQVAGTVGLGAAAAALTYAMGKRRDRVQVWLPSVLLMLFGLGSGLLILAGRADLGVRQAMAPRYITISNHFWIGLLMFIGTLALDSAGGASVGWLGWRRAIAAVSAGAVVALTLGSNSAAFEAMHQFSHRQRVLRYALFQGDRGSQMTMLYPDVWRLYWYKEVVRRNRLWAWRPGAPASMFDPPPPFVGDRSDPESLFRLGVKYAKGDGVRQDYAKAFEAWTKAAEQGHGAAQFNLGLMYSDGTGAVQDRAKAFEWYTKAANSGVADAQFNLGAMYARGESAPQDYAKAFDLWTKAAEQGYALAEYNLGLMYANGVGAIRDDEKSIEWCRKAAEKGLAAAQFDLGEAYAVGRGVARDDSKAYVWLDVAAGQGYEGAGDKREEVRARMTIEQVEDARRASSTWSATHKIR
jgi:hypothetical protein